MSVFSDTIVQAKYAWPLEDGTKETWGDIARRVATEVVGPYFPERVLEVEEAIRLKKFMPGGRYLYASGREFHQTQNCLLLTVEDSREGWASLMRRMTEGSMTGAGVGVVYSKLRPKGALVKGMGGESTGPLALMNMVNEAGRYIMQGGSRRVALWAGLHWNHADVFDFIVSKDYDEETKARKAADYSSPAPMDNTNISVILDDDFFEAYHDPNWVKTYQHPYGEQTVDHAWAVRVYDTVVAHALKHGEPGFSVDVGENAGEHLRNACTEITSADDDDICNLGSINLAQVETLEEYKRLVDLGTLFLLCGTLYSLVPYAEVGETRTKNRRLGLGNMGFHEWLLLRGKKYGPDAELGEWMAEYAKSTEIAAGYADALGISRPIKTRAIAPTGTIAIVAETTSGIEPIFCVAIRRVFMKDGVWKVQYVVDATAKRLLERGVAAEDIEDAYDLADDPGRRLGFQAWLQQYVDHGISSTLNLPPVEKQSFTPQEFGALLMDYLPLLRGVTVYPDGARGGQPLTKADLEYALEWEGVEFEEFGNEQACVSGVCGV